MPKSTLPTKQSPEKGTSSVMQSYRAIWRAARERDHSMDRFSDMIVMSQTIVQQMIYDGNFRYDPPKMDWRKVKRRLRKIGLVRKGVRRS